MTESSIALLVLSPVGIISALFLQCGTYEGHSLSQYFPSIEQKFWHDFAQAANLKFLEKCKVHCLAFGVSSSIVQSLQCLKRMTQFFKQINLQPEGLYGCKITKKLTLPHSIMVIMRDTQKCEMLAYRFRLIPSPHKDMSLKFQTDRMLRLNFTFIEITSESNICEVEWVKVINNKRDQPFVFCGSYSLFVIFSKSHRAQISQVTARDIEHQIHLSYSVMDRGIIASYNLHGRVPLRPEKGQIYFIFSKRICWIEHPIQTEKYQKLSIKLSAELTGAFQLHNGPGKLSPLVLHFPWKGYFNLSSFVGFGIHIENVSNSRNSKLQNPVTYRGLNQINVSNISVTQNRSSQITLAGNFWEWHIFNVLAVQEYQVNITFLHFHFQTVHRWLSLTSDCFYGGISIYDVFHDKITHLETLCPVFNTKTVARNVYAKNFMLKLVYYSFHAYVAINMTLSLSATSCKSVMLELCFILTVDVAQLIKNSPLTLTKVRKDQGYLMSKFWVDVGHCVVLLLRNNILNRKRTICNMFLTEDNLFKLGMDLSVSIKGFLSFKAGIAIVFAPGLHGSYKLADMTDANYQLGPYEAVIKGPSVFQTNSERICPAILRTLHLHVYFSSSRSDSWVDIVIQNKIPRTNVTRANLTCHHQTSLNIRLNSILVLVDDSGHLHYDDISWGMALSLVQNTNQTSNVAYDVYLSVLGYQPKPHLGMMYQDYSSLEPPVCLKGNFTGQTVAGLRCINIDNVFCTRLLEGLVWSSAVHSPKHSILLPGYLQKGKIRSRMQHGTLKINWLTKGSTKTLPHPSPDCSVLGSVNCYNLSVSKLGYRILALERLKARKQRLSWFQGQRICSDVEGMLPAVRSRVDEEDLVWGMKLSDVSFMEGIFIGVMHSKSGNWKISPEQNTLTKQVRMTLIQTQVIQLCPKAVPMSWQSTITGGPFSCGHCF